MATPTIMNSITVLCCIIIFILFYIFDRVCIKGPFFGNLKNEIIKFYDKLGFKASFPLISEKIFCFCYIKKHFPSGIPGCKNY